MARCGICWHAWDIKRSGVVSDWGDDKGSGTGEEHSAFSAASSASYFFLILSYFAAFRCARSLSAFAATAAFVPVIFRLTPFLLEKLRSLGSLRAAEFRLFCLASLAFTVSTNLAVCLVNTLANSSAAAPVISFYFSTAWRALLSIRFWPWFLYRSPACLSYSVDVIKGIHLRKSSWLCRSTRWTWICQSRIHRVIMMMNIVQNPSVMSTSHSLLPAQVLVQKHNLVNGCIHRVIKELAILWLHLMSRRKCIDRSPNVSCSFPSDRARIGLHCGKWCWGGGQVSRTKFAEKNFSCCGLDFRIISCPGR